MSAAPSAAIRTPCSTAAATETKRPPSEKESGVTFSTPMTTGRLRSSVWSAQRSTSGGDDMSCRGEWGADAGEKGVSGTVKNRDVFAGASRDGFTAVPETPFSRAAAWPLAAQLVLPRRY